MANIFLSYDHDDAARAAPIVTAFEKAGHNVWWDRHIHGGAQYNTEIENAVAAADALVVLWSERSVQSAWVRDEAAEGRERGKLVPVSLDGTRPPMGFRQFQTIDLSSAKGRRRAAKVQEILVAVENVSGAPAAPLPRPTDHKAAARTFRWGRRRSISLLLLGLATVSVGLVSWHFLSPASAVPIAAIHAADARPDSRTLARNLFVRLGAAQSGRAQSFQLVDENARKAPDLILEVSVTTSAADPSASLVLLRAKDRQLLFSQDLTVQGKADNLQTWVAIAAASAIGCATAALDTRPSLPLDVLKRYLGACTSFASLYGMEDVSILIPQLEQVVQREPHFLPARKQLLLAGAFVRSIPTEVAKPSSQWLRAQIATARRIEPSMPELRLAELELLPLTDFAERIRLVDGLREAHPDDMFVLGARAEQLMLVGRNNEAVVDAERTARLDPLASYSRSEYIRALAFSGRLSRAFEELSAFQPFSPVAMNLTDTTFRLNMRYGDPQPALKILRTYGTSKAHEAFLLARLGPTQENIERAIALARVVATERGFYATPSEVLEAFGRDDEAFQMLMQVPPERVDQFMLQTLFRPTLKNLRQKPRFLRVAQHFGLLDYWRRSGNWPDFCNEPGLPYDCKKEAARLAAADT
ncbi:MAG: toll/interleukin-1 receptor domain-containing protein [Sphingomicrobium sp.]